MRHNILHYIIAFHLGSTENNNHNITILKGSFRLRRLFVILHSCTHVNTGSLYSALNINPLQMLTDVIYKLCYTHTHARTHILTAKRFHWHCNAYNWLEATTLGLLPSMCAHSLVKLSLQSVSDLFANTSNRFLRFRMLFSINNHVYYSQRHDKMIKQQSSAAYRLTYDRNIMERNHVELNFLGKLLC